MTKTKTIVYTDLDGSLLDHETYDFSPAQETLDRLQELEIPLIPVTSKTIAEIKALDLPFTNGPMIAENGMVINIPTGHFGQKDEEVFLQARPYETIIDIIASLPEKLRSHICGFNDMTEEQVAENTGLPIESAKNAKNREASEPFIWGGNSAELADLEERLRKEGLSLTRGGRFHHIIGKGGKGTAIEWLNRKYIDTTDAESICAIALGDGPNDAGMLSVADYGIIIPNAQGKTVTIENPAGKIIKAPAEGPEGWSKSLESLLDDLCNCEEVC